MLLRFPRGFVERQTPPSHPPFLEWEQVPRLTEAEQAGGHGVAQGAGHGQPPGAEQQQQHEAQEQAQLGPEDEDGQRREPDEAGPALLQPGRQGQQHCGRKAQRHRSCGPCSPGRRPAPLRTRPPGPSRPRPCPPPPILHPHTARTRGVPRAWGSLCAMPPTLSSVLHSSPAVCSARPAGSPSFLGMAPCSPPPPSRVQQGTLPQATPPLGQHRPPKPMPDMAPLWPSNPPGRPEQAVTCPPSLRGPHREASQGHPLLGRAPPPPAESRRHCPPGVPSSGVSMTPPTGSSSECLAGAPRSQREARGSATYPRAAPARWGASGCSRT